MRNTESRHFVTFAVAHEIAELHMSTSLVTDQHHAQKGPAMLERMPRSLCLHQACSLPCDSPDIVEYNLPERPSPLDDIGNCSSQLNSNLLTSGDGSEFK